MKQQCKTRYDTQFYKESPTTCDIISDARHNILLEPTQYITFLFCTIEIMASYCQYDNKVNDRRAKLKDEGIPCVLQVEGKD